MIKLNKNGKYYCDFCSEEIENGELYFTVYKSEKEHIHEKCFQQWAISYTGAKLLKMESSKQIVEESNATLKRFSFEKSLDEEYEQGKELGSLWVKLDVLRHMVTKNVMTEYGLNDEDVMDILMVDEAEYRELQRKLNKLLNNEILLQMFNEEEEIGFLFDL